MVGISKLTTSSMLGSNAGDAPAWALAAAGAGRAGAAGAAAEPAAASSAVQPALATRRPSAVTSRYSAPGTVAARARLSAGVSTVNAVARAPASVGLSATTVALMTAPAGTAVRGSTMCE